MLLHKLSLVVGTASPGTHPVKFADSAGYSVEADRIEAELLLFNSGFWGRGKKLQIYRLHACMAAYVLVSLWRPIPSEHMRDAFY